MKKAQGILWGYTLLVIAAGTALVGAMGDSLPDPVATHWGIDGSADGFTSLSTFPYVTAAVIAGSIAVLSLAMRVLRHAPPSLLTGVGVGLAQFVGSVTYGDTLAQRGLTDAAEAKMFTPWTIVGAMFAIPLGIVVWRWLLSDDPIPGPADPSIPRPTLDVSATSRVAWSGRTRHDPLMLTVLGMSWTAAMVAVVVLGAPWWVVAITVVVGMLVWLMVSWHVTIGAGGVRVKALNLLEVKRIPLAGVTGATVEHVNALKDYGGWGVRYGRTGAVGIITASGDALRLERAGQRSYVITVDDAVTAAATLNTLRTRRSMK